MDTNSSLSSDQNHSFNLGSSNSSEGNYSIFGLVVDSQQRGLNGVTVTLWQKGTQIASTITSVSGSYTFPNLAPGDYIVTAGGLAKDGISYEEKSYLATITDGNQKRYFKLNSGSTPVNPPGTYSISGTVNAVNIGVTLWQGEEQVNRVTTDDRGNYFFHSLLPGKYTVKAGGGQAENGEYYEEQSKTITIADGNVQECNFTLNPVNLPDTYSISGETVNGAQSPMKGLSDMNVTLWQKGVQIRETTSGSLGKYAFPNLAPGEYTVKASGFGWDGTYYAEQSKTITITDRNQEYTFEMMPGNLPDTYSISGKVFEWYSSSQIDIANITVTIWKGEDQVDEVTTNKIGEYTFTSIAPGEYIVKAGGWGGGKYYAEQSEAVTITDENVQRCDFALNPGRIPGTYLISVSTNVAGITVMLWNDVKQIGEVTADNSGNHTFANLMPGEYTVKVGGWANDVSYLEQSQIVTITDRDQTCNFTLNPSNLPGTYSISGSVNIASMTMTLWQAGKQVRGVTTDGRGNYVFYSISPGVYTVKTGGWNGDILCYEEQSNIITIEDRNVQGCNFTLNLGNLPDTYSISGTVSSSDSVIRGISVTLWQGEKQVRGVTTDNNGNYVFYSLSPGVYTVKAGGGLAWDGTYFTEQSKPVTIEYGNQTFNFTLNPNLDLSRYSISGTVNAVNIGVTLWQAGKQVGGFTTDSNGNYIFHSLSPGEYTVKVGGWANGGYYTEQSKPVTIADKNVQECNFTLNLGNAPGRYSISGTVNVANIGVTLWQGEEQVGGVTTDNNGNYVFYSLLPGVYTVKTGGWNGDVLCYEEQSKPVTIEDKNVQGCNFTLNLGNLAGTYSISGSISSSDSVIKGISVTLWQAGERVRGVTTDNNGNYVFYSLSPGVYTVKAGGGQAGNGEYYEKQSQIITIKNDNQECSFTLNFNYDLSTYSISGIVDRPNIRGLPIELWQDGVCVAVTHSVKNTQVMLNPPTQYTFYNISPGSYTLRVPAGTYGGTYYQEYLKEYIISNLGWVPSGPSISMYPGTPPTNYPLSGTVTASGTGAADVPVQLWRGSIKLQDATTDTDGAYRFEQVAIGSYTLKVPAGVYGGKAYAQMTKEVTISGAIQTANVELTAAAPLTFTDSADYDISASTAGTAITPIDVSGGVMGGGPPYTFSATGLPAGLSISAGGSIHGTPTSATLAGTATITVTDALGSTESITINYGAVSQAQYTITFDYQGADGGNTIPSITVNWGEKYGPLPVPTKIGFHFAGWFTAMTSGKQVMSHSTVLADSDYILYAHWKQNATVTLSEVEIVAQPDQTTYIEGDALDLTGLQVKLSYSDGNSKTVALANFADNGITTNPANGAELAVANTTVIVSAGGKSASFNITINAMPTVETPTFSPASGTYTGTQSVTLSSKTEGATIYYTTNGTAPTTSSTKYTGAITVSSTTTIKAIAVKDGMKDSAVSSATYTIQSPPPAGKTPSFTQHPSNQVVTENQTAIFTVIVTGDPAPSYQWEVNEGSGWNSITGATNASYTTPATTATMNGWQFRCVATNSEGSATSNEVTLTVNAMQTVVTPAFSPAGGTYIGTQSVTITSETKGATIYYTTNGTKPTTSSTKYTGAITVSSTTTIKAIAVKDGMKNSEIASASYVIKYQITATAGDGGSISPSGNVIIAEGGEQTFTITANDGYVIKSIMVDESSVAITSTYTFENVTKNHQIAVEFKEDITPPTGKITIGNKNWSTLLKEPTFSLFFKDAQDVMITADDDSGKAVTIQYYLHREANALTDNDLKNLEASRWKEYAQFSIQLDDKLVIYAKLTDKAGNVTYISSNGIVLDETPPAFSGAENNQTYATIKTITVSDTNLKSVLLNEKEQSIDGSSTSHLITLNTNGTYTIKAKDKAGNEAAITVIIQIPPNLTKIESLEAIEVENGTSLEDIKLPDQVTIVTSSGNMSAVVAWDSSVTDPTYDSSKTEAQTFTISGKVALPNGVTNTDDIPLEVKISVTVAAKVVVTVSKVEISTMPTKTTYTEGEVLDLTGLQVKLSYSDGSSKIFVLTEFANENIITDPVNGTKLSVTNTKVSVSAGSKSASFDITVNAMPTVETPTFSPAGETYTSTQEVTLSSKTEEATIYYTTNGTEPTTSSTEYTGPITVSSITTIKAIAVKDGMKDSQVATAEYIIKMPVKYDLVIVNGTDLLNLGSYEAGTIVNIEADEATNGKVFDKWTGYENSAFGNITAAQTTFIMPAEDVTITATYKNESSSGPSTPPVDPPVKPPVDPDPEPIKPDENGNAEIKVDEEQTEELINNAVDSGSATIELVDTNNTEGELTSVTVSTTDLQTISDKLEDNENVNSISITTSTGTIVVEQEVLADILSNTAAETVSFAVNNAKDKLTEEQKQAVGNNPVFEINIHADDQKVTSFNGKTITISLPYELKEGEDPNNIVIYHLKDDGTIEKMKCVYHDGQVSFETNHLSMFFIAYEAAEPVTPDQPDDNKNNNIIYYILAAIVVIILIIALAYYFLQKKQ